MLFVEVTDGSQVLLFPANRIDCVLRTDRSERDDIVRIMDDPTIYTCYDETGSGSFENSLIEYCGEE